jgi:hypothetical protein
MTKVGIGRSLAEARETQDWTIHGNAANVAVEN